MGVYLIPPNWALENGWNGNLMLTNFTTAKRVFLKKKKKTAKRRMRTPFLLTPFEPQTFSGKDAKPCFVFSYGVSVKRALFTCVNSAVPVNTDKHAVWKVFL